MNASQEMQEYFKQLKSNVESLHSLASKARERGYDPEDQVEVSLAENMAERIVGLISVVAPQIVGSGVIERIIELEKEYGSLDWRVALKIAEEVAKEKFCKFKNKEEAMEVGIRTGFAYVTNGIVSSPLDGIVNIQVKNRMDGRGEYICMNFAGPIRNAGGTAAAVSVIITDHVRNSMGYDVYDAQPEEIKRAKTELRDYHERVTNLQYFPSDGEIEHLMKHIPVEVSGDPSEKIDVSNHKDLPRIPTNKIRSGYCLVLSSCIPLKAPKLWKQLSKWGKDFNLQTWDFLEEFIKIQKKAKAGKSTKEKSTAKISPDYTYIADIVAGRPVLGYPLREGGFRLRYGRSRTSGYSAQSIHPATMHILNKYIATGTQLKTERPGKAASMTSCDSIDGPTVKLKDGSVIRVRTLAQAKEIATKVEKILFLGDILIAYGDFFNRAHPLVPAGYCPEWWAQELERAIENKETKLNREALLELTKNPLRKIPTAHQAIAIAKETKTPLHPEYTAYWKLITPEQLKELLHWLDEAKIHTTERGVEKIILPIRQAKKTLEDAGIEHSVANSEFVIITNPWATVLEKIFCLTQNKPSELAAKMQGEDALEKINSISEIKQRDKAGTFIGTRMGRPEKAKQRELTGSPHVIFPVGEEGGRLRSFQSALAARKVTSTFPFFYCKKCDNKTVFRKCELCDIKTTQLYNCKRCGLLPKKECDEHGPCDSCDTREIDINKYFESTLKKMGLKQYPDLIKGVRGTVNSEHIPEHIAKGIFRARYGVHVYKDGTTRYDMTQLPMTHFKPCEIGVSIEKLKELGYKKDINGKELERENQILEIKPQDIVLPNPPESPDSGAAEVLANVAKFVDDTLEHHYGLERFYNIKNPKDLIGHLTIALAPHTSAGIVSRIIGFSKTQGLLAHPLLHAITRRDCDGDEACVILLLDAFLNFSKKYLPSSRGSTMDTPLVLTSILTPTEVDDMAFDVDIEWKYPLELYQAALEYKAPWDVKINQIQAHLGKPTQYEQMGFTHDNGNINMTVACSAYKTLPSMQEKLEGQMDLAVKLRSVNESDVAQLVIEKHFLKDTKGNLRKFSQQMFRCVKCNEKFRRPPLAGKCTACSGKIIFTISEGSVVKYLQPTIDLAEKYNVTPYLKQVIELLRLRVEGVFGKDPEKQLALGDWF